ncbi:MAG: glycerol-3-phosphate 1-O-acyltransferase PlsY [Eubacteriales bacterium]
MLELFQNGLYTYFRFVNENWLILSTLFCTLMAIAIPYLLGSVNSAIVISKLLYADDIRRHGSGNAGMSNMLRVYGKKAALFTLLGDLAKTVLAVLVGGLFMGLQYVGPFSLGQGGYLAAFFCITGHVFPVFYRFKGGKGVLCAAAAILLLNPVVFAIELVCFVIIVAFTRYMSLGSVVCVALYPLLLHTLFPLFVEGPGIPLHLVVFAFALAAFVIWMHRSNLRRLWRGEESKISFSK